MIAGISFPRCHEARWHGTSATATARKQTPYFYQLIGETGLLQSIGLPNTPYLGVTLSTDLKFNIHLNKICQIIPMPSFYPSQPKLLPGETATSILHFPETI